MIEQPPEETALERQRKTLRFQSGKWKGQTKVSVVKKHFRELLEEAAAIALAMEDGSWVDPMTGKLHETRRIERKKIGIAMGFSVDEFLPTFLREPAWSRGLEWARVQREATMRMSAATVKPMVSVAASAMLMELLNRVLNNPESMKDRELVVECRKYIEMLVAWDEGSKQKPLIQNTIQLLIQNINGLPDKSRTKVMRMVGHEVERAVDAMRQLAREVRPEEKEEQVS